MEIQVTDQMEHSGEAKGKGSPKEYWLAYFDNSIEHNEDINSVKKSGENTPQKRPRVPNDLLSAWNTSAFDSNVKRYRDPVSPGSGSEEKRRLQMIGATPTHSKYNLSRDL